MRYLLSCPCGQSVPVETCQAGQTVTCRCGTSLEVPTMRELARLQRVDTEADPRQMPRRWGIRHRIILVASLLIIVGGGLGLYLFWNRPVLSLQEPDRESVRQYIEALSPLETWQRWQQLRTEGLSRRNPATEPAYVEALFRYRLGLGVALLVVASGAGLIIAALWFIPEHKIRPKR